MLSTKHVPGTLNSIADYLSRFRMQGFRELSLQARSQPDVATVPEEITYYAACSITSNTRQTYHAIEKSCWLFCALNHWSLFPPTDTMLCCFVAFLARTVCPGTVHVYMAAVHDWHHELGYEDPVREAWLHKRVLRGSDRCPSNHFSRPRLPFSMAGLRQLVDANHRSTCSMPQQGTVSSCHVGRILQFPEVYQVHYHPATR